MKDGEREKKNNPPTPTPRKKKNPHKTIGLAATAFERLHQRHRTSPFPHSRFLEGGAIASGFISGGGAA